jgi:hypothetical protein
MTSISKNHRDFDDIKSGRRISEHGGSLLISLVLLAVGSVFVVTIGQVMLNAKNLSQRTQVAVDAEAYNRAGIAAFADRWNAGHVSVSVVGNLTNTTPTEGTGTLAPPPVASRSWEIVGSAFRFLRCPPVDDVNPAPGVYAAPVAHNGRSCETNWGNAAKTDVRVLNINSTLGVARVVARTTFPNFNSNLETEALITVPQLQKDIETVCKLEVRAPGDPPGGDGDYYSEQSRVANLVVGQSVQFRVHFTRPLTKKIEAWYRSNPLDPGTESAFTINQAAAMANSPFDWTWNVTGAAGSSGLIRFQISGIGLPCEHAVEVHLAPPPPEPPCKWLRPGYFEPITLNVCRVNIIGNTQTFTTGQLFVPRVGLYEGWGTPELAAHSANIESCTELLNAGAPSACVMRSFRMMPLLNPTPATIVECGSQPNGLYAAGGGFPRERYIIGMFDVRPGRCSARIVAARSKVDGCLRPDSQIVMADGSLRRIDSISEGEYVRNPITNGASKVSGVTVGSEQEALLRISIEGDDRQRKSIMVTVAHPMWTTEGFIRASDVKIGQQLIDAGKQARTIVDIDEVHEHVGEPVWNLLLETSNPGVENAHFIADGLIVGDGRMQQILELR